MNKEMKLGIAVLITMTAVIGFLLTFIFRLTHVKINNHKQRQVERQNREIFPNAARFENRSDTDKP